MLTELFRDHGILEDYPQTWAFHPKAMEIQDRDSKVMLSAMELSYSIVEKKNESDDTCSLQVVWVEDPKLDNDDRNYAIRYFRRELKKFNRMQNVHLDLDSPLPPFEKLRQTEWDLIRGYYQATMHSMKIAIDDLTTNYDATSASRK